MHRISTLKRHYELKINFLSSEDLHSKKQSPIGTNSENFSLPCQWLELRQISLQRKD